MKRLGNNGFVNGLAMAMILVSLIAIGAIVFGAWAYTNEVKYKNNADQLIAAAVQNEKNKESAIKTQQFNLASQNPYNTYYGPQIYGSVDISYPKTWSGYVDASGNGGAEVQAYFQPGVVPAIENSANLFALRMQINSSSYSTNLANYTNSQTSGNFTITPYKLPKLPNVVGVMIKGTLINNKQGVLVMFPIRTSTLEIWTDSPQYANLLENNILPTVSFKP